MKKLKYKPITLVTFFAATMFFPVGLSSSGDAYNYGTGLYGSCVYSGELGSAALSFSVSASSVNLTPRLTASTTATGTTTFSVAESCSNNGYVVTILGSPPTNNGYTLANLTSPTASSPGTEQYGVNLVANTTPSIGANPSGGSGVAASGYGTPDSFKYVSGNTIASTATYSDTTTYTLSFMANASSVTKAGDYTTTHTLICTATY